MMPEKKIYNVLTCYYRPKPGGFCKRLFRAINALLDRGHIVHYLAVVPFPIDHQNCHFHRFPWPEKHTSGYLFWGLFHLFTPLQLLYIGFKYKIHRAFAFGHNYALFLQPLRIIKQIPLAVFLRADTIENHRIQDRSNLLIYLEHVLEGLGISGTNLYGVSETLVNKTLSRHKVFKPLTSGVFRNDIPQYTAIPEKIKKTPLRLACVGVLEVRKNQRFLLEVMEEIKKEQAQLYIYGIGPDEQYLKKMVEKRKLTDRVWFMGWVPSNKIWPSTDMLLMPSLHEGAPNAVLEALSNHVPVLASNIVEHAEILPSEDLLPIGQSREWVRFLNTEKIVLIAEIEKIANRQCVSCRKLVFNWGELFVQLISKD